MVLPAGAGKAGGHYHLDFDQHFDVLAGTATMTVEGEAADGHVERGAGALTRSCC